MKNACPVCSARISPFRFLAAQVTCQQCETPLRVEGRAIEIIAIFLAAGMSALLPTEQLPLALRLCAYLTIGFAAAWVGLQFVRLVRNDSDKQSRASK